MKKAFLMTSLLLTQVTFASTTEQIDACNDKVKLLSANFITLGGEKRSDYNPTERSTLFKGVEPDGRSCEVEITTASFEGNSDQGAHDKIYYSIYTDKHTSHYLFKMNTDHVYVLTGIPGGPSKANFKVGKCDVDTNGFTANVTFSSFTKELLNVTNKGYGIREFKVGEDGNGIGGLFRKRYSKTCTVDIYNQK